MKTHQKNIFLLCSCVCLHKIWSSYLVLAKSYNVSEIAFTATQITALPWKYVIDMEILAY